MLQKNRTRVLGSKQFRSRPNWTPILLGSLILGCFLPSGVPPAARQTAWAQSSASPAKQLEKFVLQVGIDDYQYVDKLHGCVQDVVDMKELLIKKFEVPADHFLTLTNQQGTRDAIISAFRKHLIENAKRHREAIVIFQYSGHGSRVPDQNGDKADGLDSTLVPVNSRDPEGKNFDIVDDEIRELFDELSRYTSNISFIIDACHSGNPTRGGATRGIGIDTRRQPPEKTKPPGTRSGGGLRGGEMTTVLPRDQRYVSLVATQASEAAHEKTVVEGQKTNGALTFHLLRALERATPETTYREVMEEVASAVTADFASQHPQLEGDLRRPVFAGSANREDVFIRIEEIKEKQVTIAAGLAQGIQPGTIVAIYAPEARRLAGDDKRLAVGAVTEVGPFSAKLVLKDTSSISAKAKAVVVSADFASSRMRVALDSRDASTRAAAATDRGLMRVAELLKDNPKISLVDVSLSTAADSASYNSVWDVAVRRDKFANAFKDRGERGCADNVEVPAVDQQVFFLADQSGRPLFDFFVNTQDPAGPQKIVTALDYLANQRALRSIRNERSQLKGGIKINVLRVSGDFAASPPRIEREEPVSLSTDQQDYRFDQCEYFRFEIENHSGKDLYITLFDLGTDGSIQILYPPKGGTMLIPNGEKIKPNLILQTTGPAGYETFKIIATTEKKGPSDFAFLEQAGVGATRAKPLSVAEFADWTTTQIIFVIGKTIKR